MSYVYTMSLIIFAIAALPGAVGAATVVEKDTYSYSDTISDSEGCNLAFTRTKKKALESACGTQFSATSSRYRTEDADEMALFDFESVGGRIVAAKITAKNVTTIRKDAEAGEDTKQCAVTARISVECDSGKRDPGFAPSFSTDVKLNEMTFREKENMQIFIHANSEMYITIFQFIPYETSEENVYRLFPNRYQKQTLLKEGDTLSVPDYEAAKGYKFTASLPPKKDRVVEELMLVATKKKVVFADRMNLGAFQRILSEIPLDERREAIIPYYIVKKGVEVQSRQNDKE